MSGRISTREAAGAARVGLALILRAAPGRAVGSLAVTIASAGLPIATAWSTKSVIDRLADPHGSITAPALALAGIGLVATVLPGLGRYLHAQIGRATGVLATDRLFGAAERQVGLRRFEDPAFLDRLRLAKQSTTNVGGLVDGAGNTLQGSLTLVGFIGSLLILSPTMTALVLVAGVPVLIAELRLSRMRAGMLWENEQVHRREFFYGGLLTGVQAATEIRLFGIGPVLRARMMGERLRANEAERRMDLREFVTQAALGALGAAVAGGGLWWAVTAAHDGRLTVGDVVMFVAALTGIQNALNTLVASIAATYGQLLGLTHYVAVSRAEPDLVSAIAGPTVVPVPGAGIEFHDVWFRYSDEHPWVLGGVDLSIPHGRAVALVGLNGAGKSTLVKLLCRMYDPTRGRITWDGVDLREIPPAALRERISAVFQDHMNYDMSAADNIALGDPTHLDDRDRIEAAAQRAGIHAKLAALPRGYDTLLTRMFFSEADKADPDTGVVLSGGQWQRLALARAFVRVGRELMILDEPSSGLDPQAEHEVHTRMREYREGGTSLLISHRLGAVRDADVIVVLSAGRIAEQGSHEELLDREGYYAKLFRLQAAGYQEAK
ncbi:ABC transporter ATP-binding protein [Embleya hyalina]|uniref:Multidrug ABC transporter permease n=1 Tax=Embleya hyalina TaxID=516124 RepID=A0A401YJF3_9ACTN|nr:ABC transporter ATP-binding protein [Embleya hyalina]GCD94754.1 multidrug ABC transporter permease [Embleya hyalina]